MRGPDEQTHDLFSYVSPESRVRADHPLRRVRQITDAVFADLSATFEAMYLPFGRPSIPPEHLLRALILQVLYSIRSERLLMDEIDYSILFRWFIGLGLDEPVWSPTTFSKNRDRLMAGEVAARFFDAVVTQAAAAALLSDEHFTVDGTQLEAWASLKSFTRRDAPPSGPPDDPGNPTVDFRGEKRSNATHDSTTDPDAQLYKKAEGQKSVLSYLGHVLMENRHGLIVNACATEASGTAEREAALLLLHRHRRCTLGADKSYDVASFVTALRAQRVTPHIAQKRQYSALDRRTTRTAGYAISQRKRKLVEQAFGWMKTVGLLRKLRHRRGPKVDWVFTFTAALYNVVRLRTLVPATATG